MPINIVVSQGSRVREPLEDGDGLHDVIEVGGGARTFSILFPCFYGSDLFDNVSFAAVGLLGGGLSFFSFGYGHCIRIHG